MARERGDLSMLRFAPSGTPPASPEASPALPGDAPDTYIVGVEEKPQLGSEYNSTPSEWDRLTDYKGRPRRKSEKGPWPISPLRELGVPMPRGRDFRPQN